LTLDCLYEGEEFEARLFGWLNERYNVQNSDVLFLASHTHFAPAFDSSKPLLGLVDREHFEWALEGCTRLLRQLLEGPVHRLVVRKGTSEWDGAIHRRRRWLLPYFVGRYSLVWGQPAMAPNPKGPLDKQISLWDLAAADGPLIAVVWSCACHPTGYPFLSRVSSDYCGPVRKRIRQQLATEVPILFMQGFSGDIRPRVYDSRPLGTRFLKTLIEGPTFAAFDAEQWSVWVGNLCQAVLGARSNARRGFVEFATGHVRSALTSIPLAGIVEGVDDRAQYVTFKRLQIGNIFDIVAISAEPSTSLRNLLAFKGATPVGCLGNVFGYWPTERQRREGGYEGRLFLPAFSLEGRFRSGLDDKFRSAIEALEALS
jgi:hypothetical protein